LTKFEKQEQHRLDPPECPPRGRLQIGTLAGFKSERVAGFKLECMAGFIGIRTVRILRRFATSWRRFCQSQTICGNLVPCRK
jgi:hypothetical protein